MDKERKWFTEDNFETLEIQEFKHAIDKAPKRKALIVNKDEIKQLVDKIKKLPTEGDMFVSFASSIAYTSLEFKINNNKETIELYGNRIKTPGTSFYARSGEVEDLEKDITNTINELFKKHSAK